MRAIIIPMTAELPMADIQIEDRADACLRDLRELVGGDIETIAYPGRSNEVAPYIHGEGKLIGLPRNDRATVLLAASMFPDDYIAGNCVLTGFDWETGETVELPADVTVLSLLAVLGA